MPHSCGTLVPGLRSELHKGRFQGTTSFRKQRQSYASRANQMEMVVIMVDTDVQRSRFGWLIQFFHARHFSQSQANFDILTVSGNPDSRPATLLRRLRTSRFHRVIASSKPPQVMRVSRKAWRALCTSKVHALFFPHVTPGAWMMWCAIRYLGLYEGETQKIQVGREEKIAHVATAPLQATLKKAYVRLVCGLMTADMFRVNRDPDGCSTFLFPCYYVHSTQLQVSLADIHHAPRTPEDTPWVASEAGLADENR